MAEEKSPSGRLSRRRLLALATAGGAVAVAGCLGGDGEDVPEPVALEDGQACDQCQMQITNHPGPVGQAYYLDDPPEDLPDDRENGLARFCSSWCTYTYVREHEQGGPSPAGVYTTDYSTVEYELFEDAGATVISAHFAADAFARGSELSYAVNSDVEGAMGPSLVGFSNADDAESFVDEYGGKVLDQSDITLGIVRGM
jgi:copper chaperone NosL